MNRYMSNPNEAKKHREATHAHGHAAALDHDIAVAEDTATAISDEVAATEAVAGE